MAETKNLGIGVVQARGTEAVKAWADRRMLKKASSAGALTGVEILVGAAIAARFDETPLSLSGVLGGTSLTAFSTLFVLTWSRSRSATTKDVADAAAETNIEINLLRTTRKRAEIELSGDLTIAQVRDFVDRLASIDRFDLEQVSFMYSNIGSRVPIPGPKWLEAMQTKLTERAVYSGEVTPADAPEPEVLVEVGTICRVVGVRQPKPGPKPRPRAAKTTSPAEVQPPASRKPGQGPKTLK